MLSLPCAQTLCLSNCSSTLKHWLLAVFLDLYPDAQCLSLAVFCPFTSPIFSLSTQLLVLFPFAFPEPHAETRERNGN